MVALSAYLNLLFDDGSFPDRVDRVADLGYEGVEVFGFDQDLAGVADRVAANDLEWVYLSGGRPDFTDPLNYEDALESIRASVEVAAEYDIQNLNVKSGQTQPNVTHDDQRAAVVRVLEEGGDIAAEQDVTLVLEPLNRHVNHPGHFTATAAEGAEILREVDHPHVQMLFDCYHEQIMTGDLIRNFRQHVDVIGHVHIADNPGRHEPGTGEVNYENVLAAIEDSDYDGYVGCEFDPTDFGAIDEILTGIKSFAP